MNSSALYIHIPFCTRKCLFCSFVVAIAQEHRADEYVDALIKELQAHQAMSLRTVYLGGGTPSVLTDEQLTRLMHGVRGHMSMEDQAEMTIEVNPEGITLKKAQHLKALGFNRVSMGVQSLDERYLKFLGRGHDAASAVQAYGVLRQAGFDNINVDLMYAFPGQTAVELEKDVRAIAALGSEHISLYTLTIEPHSRFYAKQMKLDDENKIADHFLLVSRILEEYGLAQYEISNFARAGFESRHNINYWMGGEYIGLGVGAHGYLGGTRYWNTDKLQDYLTCIYREGRAIAGDETLSAQTRIMEKVLFGLRMNRGISIDLVPADKRVLVDGFIADDFLSLKDGLLQATARGRLVLDELSSRLI